MSAVPSEPTVLNTTAPSNFAYIDQMDSWTRSRRSVLSPKYEVNSALAPNPTRIVNEYSTVSDAISVVALDESVNEVAIELETRLDLGEAQVFAVTDMYDGTLVTDDGLARTLARDTDVSVTGSIGVLIRAVNNNQISEAEVGQWLKQWIDETDYRASSRDLSDYR